MDSVVLAFDVEGSGQYVLANPVTEVGAVVKSMKTGKTLDTFDARGHCRLDQYEKRCVDEFWDEKDPGAKRRKLYEAAPLQCHMWIAFRDFAKHTYATHSQVTLVSDNPAYDAMLVTMGLQRYLDGEELHYISGTYRTIRDSNALLEGMALCRGLARQDFVKTLLTWYLSSVPSAENVAHDHNAVHDASYIANTWIAAHHYASHVACHEGKAPF